MHMHSVKVTPDGMESLVALSEGDMRRALNVLQSTAMAHDEVNEENVYTCTGQPLPSNISKIVDWMLNESFSTAYHSEQLFDNVHSTLQLTLRLIPD